MGSRVYSVAEVNGYVARSLQMDPMLKNLSVRGEISNARRYASGHWYFTLKDENAALRCVWFAAEQRGSSLCPAEGMRVIAQGSLGLYQRDGQFQMTVSTLQTDGVGSWYERFEQLKTYCQRQGWFDEDKKKPLPPYPRRIGIVTSPDGAALRDIIHVAHRRMPGVDLLLAPTLVQGELAAEQIALALGRLAREPGVDVIILGRGGGSIEELWAFNELPVVQAVASCPVPVIAAVGHQTDFTLTDFAADVRAATPSMAAELATADVSETLQRLRSLEAAMTRVLRGRLAGARTALLEMQQRLDQAGPGGSLAAGKERLEQIHRRLEQAMAHILREKQGQLAHARALLEALDPGAVTKRGFALVRRADGSLVTGTETLEEGDLLRITLARGKVDARVAHVEKEA